MNSTEFASQVPYDLKALKIVTQQCQNRLFFPYSFNDSLFLQDLRFVIKRENTKEILLVHQ